MHRTRRHGVTALTAAIALGIAAVPAALVATSTATSSEPALLQTAGVNVPDLSLVTTDSVATVSWLGRTQKFAGGQYCELTPVAGTASDILSISGQVGPEIDSNDLAGFRSGQIGVYEQSNASQCFRVDSGSFTSRETLGLKLGPSLVDRAGPLLAQSATLDLEMRTNDVRILARTYVTDPDSDSGRALVGTYELRTGKFRGTTPLKASADDVVDTNARTGGHYQWTVGEVLFDQVEITAWDGSFALEGGIHSSKSTTFDLVSSADAYFCTGGTDEYFELAEGEDTRGTRVQFLGNADGSDCTGFDVTLDVAGDDVGFYKPLDVDPMAQFIFDVDWTVPSSGPTAQVNTPTIDFEIPGDSRPETLRKVPMEFCPAELYEGNALVGVTGDLADRQADLAALTDLVPTMTTVDGAVVPGTSGIQYACVRDPRDATITGSNLLITDQVFLIGDAKMQLK